MKISNIFLLLGADEKQPIDGGARIMSCPKNKPEICPGKNNNKKRLKSLGTKKKTKKNE